MRVAILGRTKILISVIELLEKSGFIVPLVITAKPAPEYTAGLDDFERVASKVGAVYIVSAKIDQSIIETAKRLNIDVAISVNYPTVISSEFIDCFRLGILNAHGGDLPAYKGNACQAWAILNGEEKVGLAIHKMIGGELDSGPILKKVYYPITETTKIGEILNWIENIIPGLFLESVRTLDKDSGNEFSPTQDIVASRCYPLIPEDGRINWANTAKYIVRQVNAFSSPYSGAYYTLDEKKHVIVDAVVVSIDGVVYAMPGQVLQCTDGYVDVMTGEHAVRIFKIQIDGCEYPADKIHKSIRTRLR